MPIINLRVAIEKDLEDSSYKHFLNHENYEVFSAQEDKELFTLVAKKSKSTDSVKK